MYSCSAADMVRTGDIPSAADAARRSATVFMPRGAGLFRRLMTQRRTVPEAPPPWPLLSTLFFEAMRTACAAFRLSKTLPGTHSKGTWTLSPQRDAARFYVPVAFTSQNDFGSNASISCARCTQKNSVGVWHGP